VRIHWPWTSTVKPKPTLPANLVRTPDDLPPSVSADHLLDQYKVFVETEERLVSRRQEENRFFLSVNALVLTVLSFLLKQGISDRGAWVGVLLLGAAGLTLCYAWLRIIDSYRGLNEAKFAVIDGFERHLPARMFGAEWDEAELREYQPFTRIERHVPFVFGILHLIATVLGVLGSLALIH